MKMKTYLATAFLGLALYAQDSCEPINPPSEEQPSVCAPLGYNFPYNLDICNPWHFYSSLSFTYWQPTQENMEAGVKQITGSTPLTANFITMDFEFKSGFQLAVGAFLGEDEWDSRWTYTWFRSEQNRNASATPGSSQILPCWGLPEAGTYSNVRESWSLHMDFADWILGKNYYLSPKIIFHPSIGLRMAWIRQYVDVLYRSTSLNKFVQQKSHSWAIGPSATFESNWVLGKGFKLFAIGEADLLYTQYTRLSTRDGKTGAISSNYLFRERNLGLLRPHMEMALGVSWNGWIKDPSWFTLFSAEYNFQVFFNQNMFRKWQDDTAIATSVSSNGDLFLQGLTLSARFDF